MFAFLFYFYVTVVERITNELVIMEYHETNTLVACILIQPLLLPFISNWPALSLSV